MKLSRVFGLLSIASLIVAAATPARAAESLTYLETAGRYADLRDEVNRSLASGQPADSTRLGYLCIAYGKLKEYEKLFGCAERLESSAQRGDTKFELDQRVMFINASDARPLPQSLRARAYLELAQHEKAMAAAEDVVKMLERLPETGGTSLYPTIRYRMAALEVLGIAAARAGKPDVAKQAAQQLAAASPPFIGGRMWGWIRANALSQVYMAAGRYEEALKHIPESPASMKVVVSFVNSLGPYAYRGDSTTTILELPRLVMRGKALAETGRTAEAKAAFDEILASPRAPDMGDLYWVALFERGRIAEHERQLAQAGALYRRAVELVELQRSSISTEGSKIGFVGDKQALYGRLVAVLIAEGNVADAFDYVERSKSRALVDMLAAKKDFAAPDAAKLRETLAAFDAADLSAPVHEQGGGGMRTLQLARRELSSASPELATLVTVSSVPAAELRSLVGEAESMVEYYYHGTDLYAFVLDRGGLRVTRLEAAGLTEQVREFRAALEQFASAEWQAHAQALYERLWKPLESMLPLKSVIVVPHGALHYLPFAALRNAEGSFLNDRHGLRFLPSASVLKFLRPALPKKGLTLLVLGNPDLGDARMDLKFAEAEAIAVAAMFPDSRILVRKQASAANFRKAAGGFSRIHMATHGVFEPDAPLRSGLQLAAEPGADGMLTVDELYTISLDSDLVTLSACETGLGKIASGDDVVGLTRGFLFAGSRSIVASLWSVEDRATSELMQAFYENLGAHPKQEALRLAQIRTRGRFPHPFFWAAFQLTGRP